MIKGRVSSGFSLRLNTGLLQMAVDALMGENTIAISIDWDRELTPTEVRYEQVKEGRLNASEQDLIGLLRSFSCGESETEKATNDRQRVKRERIAGELLDLPTRLDQLEARIVALEDR